ncbi:MAG: DUF3379 family protein [Opitutae bacterium]|nr:DUF3379 family protein [Opitutae bacterium]
MNNQEAKFVLHAYRPSGADAGDATFCAAIEQAKQDPVLNRWFEAQQAFDRALSAKLGSVQPPAGLRESILTGAKFSQSGSTARSWWQQPVWMAAAASVALLLTAAGLALWPKQALASEELAAFAIGDTLHGNHDGEHGADAAAFEAMLTKTNKRLSAGLPVAFEKLRSNGCRTVSFKGHDLLEVCFERDGTWFHCYVARCADFPALAKKLAPTFKDKPGASAAAWSDGEHIYVVASRAGHAALQNVI